MPALAHLVASRSAPADPQLSNPWFTEPASPTTRQSITDPQAIDRGLPVGGSVENAQFSPPSIEWPRMPLAGRKTMRACFAVTAQATLPGECIGNNIRGALAGWAGAGCWVSHGRGGFTSGPVWDFDGGGNPPLQPSWGHHRATDMRKPPGRGGFRSPPDPPPPARM